MSGPPGDGSMNAETITISGTWQQGAPKITTLLEAINYESDLLALDEDVTNSDIADAMLRIAETAFDVGFRAGIEAALKAAPK